MTRHHAGDNRHRGGRSHRRGLGFAVHLVDIDRATDRQHGDKTGGEQRPTSHLRLPCERPDQQLPEVSVAVELILPGTPLHAIPVDT